MDTQTTTTQSIETSPIKTFLKKVLVFVPILIVPLILFLVFGCAVKASPEYACAVEIAQQNPRVLTLTGEPVNPSLFAWTTYYESSGALQQGYFTTDLSGPQGKVNLQVSFFRSPAGSQLDIWFNLGQGDVEVYSGTYPCPD